MAKTLEQYVSEQMDKHSIKTMTAEFRAWLLRRYLATVVDPDSTDNADPVEPDE